MLRRLLIVAALAWIGRWAAVEVGSFLARRQPVRAWLPDPARPPGHMPGPFDVDS